MACFLRAPILYVCSRAKWTGTGGGIGDTVNAGRCVATHQVSPKSDLDSLLAFVAPFAQELLRRHGEFLPFAAILSPTGECSGLSVSPETTDERLVREILTDALKEK